MYPYPIYPDPNELSVVQIWAEWSSQDSVSSSTLWELWAYFEERCFYVVSLVKLERVVKKKKRIILTSVSYVSRLWNMNPILFVYTPLSTSGAHWCTATAEERGVFVFQRHQKINLIGAVRTKAHSSQPQYMCVAEQMPDFKQDWALSSCLSHFTHTGLGILLCFCCWHNEYRNAKNTTAQMERVALHTTYVVVWLPMLSPEARKRRTSWLVIVIKCSAVSFWTGFWSVDGNLRDTHK